MPSLHHRERAIDLLLLAVAAVWGASFLAAKDLAAETGVASAVALRFLIATAALGILCLIRRVRLPRGRGLAIAALLGCSQATVIGLSQGGLRTPTLGDLLVIAAAVVRAVHVTASARLTRGRGDGPWGIVLVQLSVCAVLSCLVAGPELPAAVGSLSAAGWVDALFLGLLCSVFAFVVQLWAVQRTSASRASILMGTEPVWALAFGVLVAGEAIGLLGVVGAVIILLAAFAGQAVERRHRRAIDAETGAAASAPAPVPPAVPTG